MNNKVSSEFSNIVFISTWKGIKKIKTEDVIYMKSSDKYSEIYLNNDDKIESSSTLSDLAKSFSQDFFYRVNRTTVINLLYAEEFLSSKCCVLLLNNSEIVVSRRRKQDFLKQWISFYSN
ncbi:LytTR family transcriptional regulator [Ancylomarina euxinus]|uniref:LytTR family transcriptional regulator n=1 Tax=Ancylomarina euxinus TaxID=2283627 RepID=A0A425Y0Z6_9BACT|nr:LytTR family DNA-binding domain-containing protein [Ancylomarina euxinus]MCZ4693788.1 LytTR family DNA-binding domain-containing protein [Ancylomarina euxinus]MUP15132.1 hypothetical protein [Ancylomarina euxinus]RRG21555.1 LytTR family transcriptional regulator [Ancylomarina euxinus]